MSNEMLILVITTIATAIASFSNVLITVGKGYLDLQRAREDREERKRLAIDLTQTQAATMLALHHNTALTQEAADTAKAAYHEANNTNNKVEAALGVRVEGRPPRVDVEGLPG